MKSLNNTEVSIQAAQRSSCQTMPKFKKLLEQVKKALAARKPAKREPPTFQSLLQDCPQITAPVVAATWMYKVEFQLVEALDEDDESSDDEISCAVFTWVCNLVSVCPLSRKSAGADDLAL